MVGVPGKSKGCRTCRRRKKGCDQKRPNCGQCLNGGYECGGYSRERTFILHPASRIVEQAVFVPFVKVSTPKLLQALEDDTISTKCRDLFWHLCMPHGDCLPDDVMPGWQPPLSCLELCYDLSGSEPCSRNAFSALIFAHISRESRTERVIHKHLYGRALQDLQVALQDPDRLFSDETLISCMLLSAYENLEGCTLDSEWLSHAQGAARIAELRGPERHRAGLAHRAFLASRTSTIYAAILRRQSTYLANEAWRTSPWDFQHRTFVDHLLDIAATIPAVLERIDQQIGESAGDCTEILEELAKVQRSLDTWKRHMKKESVPQTFTHTRAGADDLFPFNSTLWFDNHVFAHALSLYHTYCLVIAEAVHDIVKHSSSVEIGDWNLFDAAYHAKSIAKMVPYCLQPEMGALGSQIINFPLTQASRYFNRIGHLPAVEWSNKLISSKGNRALCDCSIDCESPCAEQESSVDTHCPTVARETSDESSEDGGSVRQRKCSIVMVRFVQEDPARYYVDATGDEASDTGLPHRPKDIVEEHND